MPIAQITPTVSRALPVLATVHKGDVKLNDNRPGADLVDKYRVKFTPAFAGLESRFIEQYGSLYPSSLSPIIVLSNNIDDILTMWMREYMHPSMNLAIQCDGVQRVRYWKDGEGYCYTPAPCLRESNTPCKCKASAYLYFVLPEFTKATGIVGHFLFTMQSTTDITHVQSALMAARATHAGNLTRAVFTLTRYLKKDTILTKDGKPGQKENSMVLFYSAHGQHDNLLPEGFGEEAALPSGAAALPSGSWLTEAVQMGMLRLGLTAEDMEYLADGLGFDDSILYNIEAPENEAAKNMLWRAMKDLAAKRNSTMD